MMQWSEEEIRLGVVYQVLHESFLTTPGQDHNEKYEERLKKIDDSKELTEREKEYAKEKLTLRKDVNNMLILKGPEYECDYCHKKGYALSNCEHCLRTELESQFDQWTSGNQEFDKL